MANRKIIHNNIPEDFDPYLWKCDSCEKERKYTQEEINTTHKPWPDPQNHDRDYYLTCPFCATGSLS
jgi:hypothetical protein